MSAYGYSRNTTPFIDSLAKNGVLFRTAYSHSNWTVPATASLLTSRLPSEHGAGIAGKMRLLGEDTPILQIHDDVDTLATILKRAGYKTGFFSANPFLKGNFTKGFDHAAVEWHPAKDLTAAATQWLGKQPKDAPFFLYVQYMDLHDPLRPPPPYFDLFKVTEGGKRGMEHTGTSWGEIRTGSDLQRPDFRQWRAHHVALYDGALRYVDDSARGIYRYLEELGRRDDTLFVITSDHGEEFFDHAVDESTDTNNPRPHWGIGHGHTMYEELLRVPLIFSGPAVSQHRMVDCVARHIDVLPTLLELLEIPGPRTMRGTSLQPSFGSAEPPPCNATTVIAESPAYGPDSRAVLFNQRKLIARSDGVQFLFDLRDDPKEHRNVAAQRPELVAALRTILDREQAGTRVRTAVAMPVDEETKRQLRALGYLK